MQHTQTTVNTVIQCTYQHETLLKLVFKVKYIVEHTQLHFKQPLVTVSPESTMNNTADYFYIKLSFNIKWYLWNGVMPFFFFLQLRGNATVIEMICLM